MRFVGVVPQRMKNVLIETLREYRDYNFLNLTSGGFTIDAALVKLGVKGVYSNDVSLLSVMLGRLLSGGEVEYRIKDHLEGLRKFYDRASTSRERFILLLTIYGLGEFAGEELLKNFNFRLYLDNFEEALKDTGRRFYKNFNDLLGKVNFIGRDLFEFVKDPVREDFIVLGFLPYYNGGYERLYKFLDASIEWDAVPYTSINGKRYQEIHSDFLNSGHKCVFLTDRILEGCDNFLFQQIEIDFLKRNFFYSNFLTSKKNYIFDFKEMIFRNVITREELLGLSEKDSIEVKRVRESFKRVIFNSRKLFDKAMGTGDLNFLFQINGRNVGGASIKILNFSKMIVLQDFALLNEGRLSKLIVMFLSSDEVFEVINSRMPKAIDEIDTIVYTDAPVSMKYRGVAELVNRNVKNGRRYLTYSIKRSNLSLKEVYLKWLKKYYKARA